MFTLVSINMITSFLLKFNIDFTLFSPYEQAMIIILSNIFFCLFWFVILYVIYRILVRLF